MNGNCAGVSIGVAPHGLKQPGRARARDLYSGAGSPEVQTLGVSETTRSPVSRDGLEGRGSGRPRRLLRLTGGGLLGGHLFLDQGPPPKQCTHAGQELAHAEGLG